MKSRYKVRIIGQLVLIVLLVGACGNKDANAASINDNSVPATINEKNDSHISVCENPIQSGEAVSAEEPQCYYANFSVCPKAGEISDNLYKCITGEKNFQYIVEQFNEDNHVEYVSIEQNIMDFTYALPFLESDGTQIRMDMEFKEYAISDLDGDGTDELIYYVYPGGEGYFLIFHDFGETVCAYGLRYRSVGKITYDGCMVGVDGASRSDMWKFTSFSTSGYETEEISKFDSDKDEYIVLGEPVSQEEAVSFFRQNYDDKEEIAWVR